jgi:hypothetical protein
MSIEKTAGGGAVKRERDALTAGLSRTIFEFDFLATVSGRWVVTALRPRPTTISRLGRRWDYRRGGRACRVVSMVTPSSFRDAMSWMNRSQMLKS